MSSAAAAAASPFGEARRKLRAVALHSWRTSGAIFSHQMELAGWTEALAHLLELVYLDAPHAATGPAEAAVERRFPGPKYEWWNALQGDQQWRELSPIRFCICIGAFSPRDEGCIHLFNQDGKLPQPSLHVIGNADPLKAASHKLLGVYNNPSVVFHERGHVVPKLGEAEEAKLVSFVASQQQRAYL
eukprot:jgi/Chlat1/8694/Chrsp88S08079